MLGLEPVTLRMWLHIEQLETGSLMSATNFSQLCCFEKRKRLRALVNSEMSERDLGCVCSMLGEKWPVGFSKSPCGSRTRLIGLMVKMSDENGEMITVAKIGVCFLGKKRSKVGGAQGK